MSKWRRERLKILRRRVAERGDGLVVPEDREPAHIPGSCGKVRRGRPVPRTERRP